jgi:hypothetical protein
MTNAPRPTRFFAQRHKCTLKVEKSSTFVALCGKTADTAAAPASIRNQFPQEVVTNDRSSAEVQAFFDHFLKKGARVTRTTEALSAAA